MAAFSFPVPLTELAGGAGHVLELFHGPTAAFKDVGASFLAECFDQSGRHAADRVGSDVRPIRVERLRQRCTANLASRS